MLTGVSLGPGDPDLMTYKAVETLKKSEKIFVPGEMAAEIVRPYSEPELLEFPMISDRKKLREIWARNADIVAGYAESSETAFACLGDVNTFSTFTHLRRLLNERHPKIMINTIPGVGVVPALASRFEIGLERSFEVTDGSEMDTIIVMKAVRPKKIASELKEKGFTDFILGTRLYTKDERIIRGEMPERSDYFSVLLARKR
jgi:precorrin-2/cobalt-factor-2 C20-methyltransferase